VAGNIWGRTIVIFIKIIIKKYEFLEDAYAIALQRLNPSDKESPISLAYFGIFDGHGGKEAAEFARQSLCQHILEQDDFWPRTSDENQNDQLILSAIRKGFLACHNDMWNHVEKWPKTSSGLPSTSG
jgi:protein phosphatase 1D